MEFVTRKSECKRSTQDVLIKSPKEISRRASKVHTPKYCIIVKPFHESFLPYKQIVFRGVTFSDDFSIELIRSNDSVIINNASLHPEHIFHSNNGVMAQWRNARPA
ncbi:MAG: hypothetical protein K0Q79_1203 [Flavipsychrobacter sp.]|jgi:hypothetical protein|nr:hypothetical protein [Flavipsychrobacter sp.]